MLWMLVVREGMSEELIIALKVKKVSAAAPGNQKVVSAKGSSELAIFKEWWAVWSAWKVVS